MFGMFGRMFGRGVRRTGSLWRRATAVGEGIVSPLTTPTLRNLNRRAAAAGRSVLDVAQEASPAEQAAIARDVINVVKGREAAEQAVAQAVINRTKRPAIRGNPSAGKSYGNRMAEKALQSAQEGMLADNVTRRGISMGTKLMLGGGTVGAVGLGVWGYEKYQTNKLMNLGYSRSLRK